MGSGIYNPQVPFFGGGSPLNFKRWNPKSLAVAGKGVLGFIAMGSESEPIEPKKIPWICVKLATRT